MHNAKTNKLKFCSYLCFLLFLYMYARGVWLYSSNSLDLFKSQETYPNLDYIVIFLSPHGLTEM